MNNFTQFCGIDVSKDTLDYCFLPRIGETPSTITMRQIKNTIPAINQGFNKLANKETLFVLESTGTYSSKALAALTQLGHPVFLVHPYKSKCYMAAQGVTNKNDQQAAYSLAHMGRSMDVRLYKAPSKEMQERKQILSTITALQKQQRMLSNQIHALEQYPIIAPEALTALQQTLKVVEEQIESLKQRLSHTTDDVAFNKNKEFGTSVVGIGDKTAEALLLATNNLESFDHSGQVSKFLGLVTWSHSSGTSVAKKGRITKSGDSYVRSLLYMCTRSAIRHNIACRELYQRLRKNNKPHKLAAVAVMNKLVKQFFVCVKQEVKFDNEYHLKISKNKK